MDDRDTPSAGKGGTGRAGGEALATAWDQFYAYCAGVIVRCPSVRRLSTADREDCVQEVMMEIVRKFGAPRPGPIPGELPAWIRAVSRNKAVDIVRRRYRRPEVGFDDGSGEKILDNEPADGEVQLGRGEYVSLVWEALVSLDQKVPVTSYLVFYLRTIEGWSITEVAELFQISPEQARARCHRVRKKFSSILKTKEKKRGGPRPG
jgi:RNA polymerase sigma factor (sigma-70 family)